MWFYSKKDAERAIEGVNGREVVAGAIMAPTMNKKERARMRRAARAAEKDGDADGRGSEDVDSEEEDDGVAEQEQEQVKGKKKGRVLAVDWALSKGRWEEAKANLVDESPGIEDVDDVDSENESQLDNGNGDSSSESASDVEMGIEDEDVDIDNDSRSDASQATKPHLPSTDVGTTLFIRNVPFDATDADLRALFRTFGPLRYARIVVSRDAANVDGDGDAGVEQGRSRGTGFVCFWDKEDAEACLERAERVARETGVGVGTSSSSNAESKKNPFTMPTSSTVGTGLGIPSLLTPDPSSALAAPLVLHGRTLSVVRAVPRVDAETLRVQNELVRERERRGADKRNLYLLREGVVFPASAAQAGLSDQEVEKRLKSYEERKRVLRSNPLLYVSKTRLSVRGLPGFVSERVLRKLAGWAVKKFEEEVREGVREGLSKEELVEDVGLGRELIQDQVQDEDEEGGSGDKTKTRKRGHHQGRGREWRNPLITQAKIIRQQDRIDVLTGKGRSRGYGFLELRSHADALRVLRWANLNGRVKELAEGWWLEEVRALIKELEGEIKKGSGKEGKEGKANSGETEARLRRLKTELERLERRDEKRDTKEGGSGKALVVEFSIENSQVVKRRNEKIEVRFFNFFSVFLFISSLFISSHIL